MLASCSREPVLTTTKLAILPFANLTESRAFDWLAKAGPSVVATELSGLPRIVPVAAVAMRDAYSNRATRAMHVTFANYPPANYSSANHASPRGNELRFDVAIEDLATHKTVATFTVDGAPLAALRQLAERVDANAHPYTTANEAALAAFGNGAYEQAIQQDPDFGPAWEGWILSLQQKPQEAAAVAARALQRPMLKAPIDRARIELLGANARGDKPAALAAMRNVGNLTPNDPATLVSVAEAENLARDFKASADWYRKALAAVPHIVSKSDPKSGPMTEPITDPSYAAALNGLGYAAAETGDLSAAQQAFELYAKAPGQNVNALDSLGEAHFMNGRFKEAEQYFAQVSKANPNFLNGAPLMKAAYARWLGGDLPGADVEMRAFLNLHPGDPAASFREAVWLFSTGRRDAALAQLDAVTDPKLAPTIARQKAIWKGPVPKPSDPAMLKSVYEQTSVTTDGFVRTMYASVLAKMGKVDEARSLLQLWPLPDAAGDPLLTSFMYPQFLALRKELDIH